MTRIFAAAPKHLSAPCFLCMGWDGGDGRHLTRTFETTRLRPRGRLGPNCSFPVSLDQQPKSTSCEGRLTRKVENLIRCQAAAMRKLDLGRPPAQPGQSLTSHGLTDRSLETAMVHCYSYP
jgi:hypothetical protein